MVKCLEVGSCYQWSGVSREKEELTPSVKFQDQFVKDLFLIARAHTHTPSQTKTKTKKNKQENQETKQTANQQCCLSTVLKKAMFQVTLLQEKLRLNNI